jgi:hypothetical protein
MDAEFIDDYSKTANNQDSIKLDSLNEVNLFFDKSKLPNAVNSKEVLTNVVITEYKIEDVGKEGIKTYGRLSGIFYGTIKPPNFKKEKEIEKIVTPTIQDDFIEESTIIIPASDAELLPVIRKWNFGGCLTKSLLILGLTFLLSLLLKKCNSSSPPAPLPSPAVDSLSQDNKDKMPLDSQNATIMVNDWNIQDNDRITIKINNEVVAENLLIVKIPKTFQITNLQKGNNSLEIIPTAFGKGNVTATVEVSDLKNTFRFECNIRKGKTVKKNLFVK